VALFAKIIATTPTREGKSMNVTIIHKPSVKSGVLDKLAKALPSIISEEIEVPGGNLAVLKPKQVSLEFSQASLRDVGSDIRIMIFARSNDPRTSTEDERAKAMLEKVIALLGKAYKEYSVDIRLYLIEIGMAEHSLG